MLARLSGSTAEFLSIWNIMMAGHSPFQLSSKYNLNTNTNHDDNNEINTTINEQNDCPILILNPILPGWLFDQETKTLSFIFLGTIKVTYFNPLLKNTWEVNEILGTATDKTTNTIYHTTFLNTINTNNKQKLSYFDCNISNLIRKSKIISIELTLI